MRAGLVQLTVGDDPIANLAVTQAHIAAAVAGGAGFVLTPECTNLLSWYERMKARPSTNPTV